MYQRIEKNEWSGNEAVEVKVFNKTKKEVLKLLESRKNENTRIEKLKSFRDNE
ncbi:17257_t:CDS:1, partial [Acaulospora morrowiae]